MIHIALTIDENYVRYCTVVMASILENNKMDDITFHIVCLLYTSPSPRDRTRSRMPSSA